MPGPFDISTRYLMQAYPDDWLSFLGFRTAGAAEVVDANLSAVSAEVDKVVRVDGAPPWLAHVEFQTSYDPTMGERLVRYNTMLHLQHRLAVASVLVLLRPAADGSAITGTYRVALPASEPYLSFAYGVRRLWQEPAHEILAGALGTLPLAPLGAIEQPRLPGLLRAMDERFEHEATRAEAARLRVVTYTLMGLRYPRALADQLMPGIRNMRDSVTYQAILDEGRVEGRAEGRIEGRVEGRAEGERRLLLLVGAARFGEPDAATVDRLNAISDVEVLERLAQRLLTVSSWTELLADPA